MSPGAPANPFSTGHHRAGVLDYRFVEGGSCADLFARFLAQSAEGELLGPEGTGKSTLLEGLAREAEGRGLRVQRVKIDHDGSRPALDRSDRDGAPRLLCLDEADRLSWLGFRALRHTCRREGIGLLVTTHRPLGLPTLRRTSVGPDLAVAVARAVLARSPALPSLVLAEEAAEMLSAHGGDLRRALLGLYDLYEERHARERKRFASAPA